MKGVLHGVRRVDTDLPYLLQETVDPVLGQLHQPVERTRHTTAALLVLLRALMSAWMMP